MKTYKTPKTFKVKINISTITSITRERDSNDEWERDSTHQYHTINGMSLVEDGECFDFILDKKPRISDRFYLVSVYYDTGDSFGRDENRISMVALLDNEEDASALAEKIQKNSKSSSFSSVVFEYKSKKMEIGVSEWKGYFEKFLYCEILPISLGGKRYY